MLLVWACRMHTYQAKELPELGHKQIALLVSGHGPKLKLPPIAPTRLGQGLFEDALRDLGLIPKEA